MKNPPQFQGKCLRNCSPFLLPFTFSACRAFFPKKDKKLQKNVISFVSYTSVKCKERCHAIEKLLSSGCKPLDDLLGGGFERGIVTQVFGAAGTGKTNVCIQLAVECVKTRFSEGSLCESMDWLLRCGLEDWTGFWGLGKCLQWIKGFVLTTSCVTRTSTMVYYSLEFQVRASYSIYCFLGSRFECGPLAYACFHLAFRSAHPLFWIAC